MWQLHPARTFVDSDELNQRLRVAFEIKSELSDKPRAISLGRPTKQ